MSKTCDNCGIENKIVPPVPYVAHQSAMARAERTQKRLIWIIVLLIVFFVGSNFAWIVYVSQFDVVEESTAIEQNNENGYNNYIGNNGDISYGEAKNNGEKEIP